MASTDQVQVERQRRYVSPMKLEPYVHFGGSCEDALHCSAKVSFRPIPDEKS